MHSHILRTELFLMKGNSFKGYEQLCVTAGGGTRKVPFGQKENLGMVCVHYNGTFYEAVPWSDGYTDFNVSTWGRWDLSGRCTSGDRPFDVEVLFECDPETTPGLGELKYLGYCVPTHSR